jgi:hypothetical protein
MFCVPGYYCFRRDGIKRRGSGVCVYVKHCHLRSAIDIANRHDLVETLRVRVKSFDVNYCVCVCYHPPQPGYHASIITELLHNNLQQLTD